jgi:predicted CopG family antitoxin
MKSITVEEETWETLTLLKVKGKFSSIDELLKSLLKGKFS